MGLKDARLRTVAIFYGVLIVMSLESEVLSQLAQAGQTQYVNTVYTDDTSSVSSRGYDNSYATNLVPQSTQPIHGQYWTGSVAQHPQSLVTSGYPQYSQYGGYGSVYQPQVGVNPYQQQYGYGYQPQQYGSQYGSYPGFDARYWTGKHYQYPAQVPVYQPHIPMYRAPVAYPHHPVYHPVQKKAKGFLGGTGSGIVKGVLGAVLAGVVAGKVVKGK